MPVQLANSLLYSFVPPRSGWQQRTGDTLVTHSSSLPPTSHNTAAYMERPSATRYNPRPTTDYYEDVDPSFAQNSQATRPVLDITQAPVYSRSADSTIPSQSLQPDAINDVPPQMYSHITPTLNLSRPGNSSYQYMPYVPGRPTNVEQASVDLKSSKQNTTAEHSISEHPS